MEYLTEHGTMPIERLYEAPCTDFHPLGVDGVFPEPERDHLIEALREIRMRAG